MPGVVVTPSMVYGDAAATNVATAQLLPPAHPGDETVPQQSADAVLGHCRGVFRQTGYEHQASYRHERVLACTLYSVIRIALEMKWSNLST